MHLVRRPLRCRMKIRLAERGRGTNWLYELAGLEASRPNGVSIRPESVTVVRYADLDLSD